MWKADSGIDTIQGSEESEGVPLALFKFKLSSRNLPDSFVHSGASVDEMSVYDNECSWCLLSFKLLSAILLPCCSLTAISVNSETRPSNSSRVLDSTGRA